MDSRKLLTQKRKPRAFSIERAIYTARPQKGKGAVDLGTCDIHGDWRAGKQGYREQQRRWYKGAHIQNSTEADRLTGLVGPSVPPTLLGDYFQQAPRRCWMVSSWSAKDLSKWITLSDLYFGNVSRDGRNSAADVSSPVEWRWPVGTTVGLRGCAQLHPRLSLSESRRGQGLHMDKP